MTIIYEDKNAESKDSFNKAVEKIAKEYKLKIIIYTVDSSGVIIRVARTYGIGEYIVNIAMFGQNHFELISGTNEDDTFVPAVNYKNELKKINNINVSDEIKKQILDLIDKITFLNIYKNELKDISATMTKNKETIENLVKNNDLLNKYKYLETFLQFQVKSLKEIEEQNTLLNQIIINLEIEIPVLQLTLANLT